MSLKSVIVALVILASVVFAVYSYTKPIPDVAHPIPDPVGIQDSRADKLLSAVVDQIPMPPQRRSATRKPENADPVVPYKTQYSEDAEYPEKATFEVWKELAKSGDAEAALRVFKVFHDCASLEGIYAKAEDDLGKNQLEKAERRLHRAKRIEKGCSEVDWSRETDAASWLRRSADDGNDEAQLLYAALGGPSDEEIFRNPDLLKDHKERAFDYWLQAAANGNVEAMSLLAVDFYDGRFSLQPNLLAALAYLYAAERSGVGSPAAPELIARWEAEASVETQEAASRLGWEILDRCCG